MLAIPTIVALAYLGWCTTMPGSSRGSVRPLSDTESEVAENLEHHVRALCQVAPRSDTSPEGYAASAAYIRRALEERGYDVRDVQIQGGSNTQNMRTGAPSSTYGVNILATHPDMEDWSNIIVVGAHYDSYTSATPGADDNASGVAATLELARTMIDRPGNQQVVFAFFANEEPPHFKRSTMGSLSVARFLRAQGATVRVMFSLEMLGFYSDEPSSQLYPPVLSWFYPDRGDFVAFVTRTEDRGLLTDTVARWRSDIDFPSEGFAGPSWVTGVDFSDHWSFWQHDLPAIMVTDTAFFRNPHYHQQTDTPETLDYERFARVTVGIEHIITSWANLSIGGAPE